MADAFEIIAIRRETIVHERTAILTHRRQHSRAIDLHVQSGRITEDEGRFCKRCIGQFADDIAIGLHVQDDPDGVREAMRQAVKTQSRETSEGTEL